MGKTALIMVLWALPAFSGGARAATVSLETVGPGNAYHLAGRFTVAAPSDVAWGVVTDYDGIGGFVSSITRSRVLSRATGAALLEQEGSASFFFVRKAVRLLLAVRERPFERVEFEAVGHSAFLRYEGSWTIIRSGEGCTVSYELTAVPEPSLGPRFAAKAVLRRSAEGLLDQVRAEIERRAAPAGASS